MTDPEARAYLASTPEPAAGPTDEELLSVEDLQAAWNSQADDANTWDELGIDEIVWWAQRQALARLGNQPTTKTAAKARAYLAAHPEPAADGPAVPDGREPASVAEQPTALINEDLQNRPTLDDIYELCEDHEFHLGTDGCYEDESAEGLLEIVRAVLARWGNHAPQPIPISERFPSPEDCDAEGRCWVWNPEMYWWEVCPLRLITINAGDPYDYWLPHWAIPTPQEP